MPHRPAPPPTLPWREVRRLDLNAAERGIPVAALMGRAGAALAKAVARRMGRDGLALLACGKGNNGGDGLAAAAMLHEAGRRVHVVLAEGRRGVAVAARPFLDRLPGSCVSAWTGRPGAAWRGAAVVVDCLLGAGQVGPPRPPYGALVRAINARRRLAAIVACDVPSGLGSPLSVRPHETVTFHAAKQGMAAENAGRITVAPIGIPRACEEEVGLGDLWLGFPPPRRGSHKGQNGRVLVVGGSLPYVGAPHYVGLGAYRTGADLVHAVVPGEAAPAVRAFGPHAIVHAAGRGPTLQGGAVAEALLERADAVAVGPGLGPARATRLAAARIMDAAADAGLPLVVDADGLAAVTTGLLARHGHRMVLTPHGREFSGLAGMEATPRNVAAYARRHKTTVLRKGPVDVIAGAARTRRCTRGHPTMTVGGTGDVLAGAVAALLAKGTPPFEAACAAAYLVGCAGEEAARSWTWGATATEVADAIPQVLLRLGQATA